jgi:protein gp37
MPTKIEWAQESWNPITGCSPISEGCENCYAKRMANRLRGRYGYPADDPFRVDGLSGATITSRGVTATLDFWLGPNGFGPYLDRLRDARRDVTP